MNEEEFERWLNEDHTPRDKSRVRKLLENMLCYAREMKREAQCRYFCLGRTIQKRLEKSSVKSNVGEQRRRKGAKIERKL